MSGDVSDVDAHPAAWGALAGAVELAARGAAAGAAGSARHAAAAAVPAAARTAVGSLAPLVMAVEAPSANIEELALRLAAMAPALLQAMRGQQAGGAVRAARSLGAHALLGDGAAALASALERPTCAQRRGRAVRARREAAAGPWQPSLRRCAAGPSSAATVLEEVDSEMGKSGGGSSGGSCVGPGPWAPSLWCCRESGEEWAAPVAGGGDAAADAPGAAGPMVRRGARRRRRRPKSLDVVKTVRFSQAGVTDSDDEGAPGPGELEGSVGVGPAAPGPPPPPAAAGAPAQGLGGGEVASVRIAAPAMPPPPWAPCGPLRLRVLRRQVAASAEATIVDREVVDGDFDSEVDDDGSYRELAERVFPLPAEAVAVGDEDTLLLLLREAGIGFSSGPPEVRRHAAGVLASMEGFLAEGAAGDGPPCTAARDCDSSCHVSSVEGVFRDYGPDRGQFLRGEFSDGSERAAEYDLERAEWLAQGSPSFAEQPALRRSGALAQLDV
ncbi:unnamed protein product [Prorocentrum cordatum]|uniref:Uncharacterized protein n=1 Tax=Prorocentrum cordatum TaxID=2364126 RepID=A0ABN9TVT6_9DINO|nr:unnamed protein product [Polarella glacialis]